MSHKIELIRKHTSYRGEQRYYRDMAEPLDRYIDLAIFVPESALEDEYSSVLYYIPDIESTAHEAASLSDYQRYANRYDMILVIPDLFGEYGGDLEARLLRYEKEKAAIDGYITEYLPQVIEHQFRAYEARSIMGYGFGGTLALNLSISFPDTFRGVSALAPWIGFHDSPAYNELFGNEQPNADLDPIKLFESKQDKTFLPAWIDLGLEDDLIGKFIYMNALEQLIAEHSLEEILSIHERPRYDHSYYFVASHIREHIVFHADLHEDDDED